MPKRIQIVAHLSAKELEQRYRQAKDGVERSHYQIIWLLAQGKRTEEVAQLTGYSRSWIYELVWGYNRLGADSLGDKRHDNPGAPPLLDDVQQAQLWQLLNEPPADGDLWDGPKVAQWMSQILEVQVHPQRGWEYLRSMELRRRRPRPLHQDTDLIEQEAWKKKLAQTVEQMEQQYPDATVEVWAEDEHRIGLHPVNRLVWVPMGEQPIAAVNWKYQWLWLIGFVHPTTGDTYWWIVPLLNGDVFSRVLEDFAQHFGVSKQKRVILVLDQAAFHTTKKVQVPEGVHLLFLPAKSPELQPAERLWPLTNEAIANRSFANLDELETATAHRCHVLLKRHDLIKGLTNFHWWAEAVA